MISAFGIEDAVLHVLDQARQQPLHRGLVRADGEALVHHVADRHQGVDRAVHADDGDDPALLHGVDRPVQRRGRPAHHLQPPAEDVLHRAAVGFRPHGVDADVRAQPVGRPLQEQHRVAQRLEVVGLAGRVVPGELEAVVHLIDHDDPPRAEEPGAPGRHDAHRAGPEHHDRVAGLDAAHLGGLVPGRHHVGEHHGIVRVHPFRDDRRAHVGIGHAHVFRLPPVVAARGVRVAEDAADRRGLGIGLVAVAVKLLLAEDTLPAGDVEGHQDVVADLQLLHLRRRPAPPRR